MSRHHVRASTRSGLVAQASGTAIHLRPHDEIGHRVAVTTEPKEEEKERETLRSYQIQVEIDDQYLNDVNIKPDRELVLPNALKHLPIINFSSSCWGPLLLLQCPSATTGKIAWDRWQVLAPRR